MGACGRCFVCGGICMWSGFCVKLNGSNRTIHVDESKGLQHPSDIVIDRRCKLATRQISSIGGGVEGGRVEGVL